MWRSIASTPLRSRGFTAVELLFTISIVGLVTALAVPNFRDFLQNSRAAEEANALVGALTLARNEAVTRGVSVSVCSSADNESCAADTDWSTGWIVFTDAGVVGTVDGADVVLRALPALPEGSALTGNANVVAYNASGFLGTPAGVSFALDIPDCTGNHNRNITVNLQGRAAVASAVCN